jgi:Flp pilus assembly CpaF family ATPase
MADKNVTDILVNSYDKVFIKRLSAARTTGLIEVGQCFESPEIFSDFVRRLTTDMGSPIGLENPLVDFVLADGARGNATMWPSSMDPSISIRRPQQQVVWTLEHYVEIDSMSQEMADFLRDCTLAGANLIAYGEVGSGKTTLLSALIDAKPRSKRIVTAEDTYEILIDPDRHPNRVRLVVANPKDERVNMRALVRNALRMQPDVLVVGETRDATAYDLLQALSVGSQGSMSTIHANGPRSALDRLSSLVLQSNLGLSEISVRQMVVNAINILVYTRPLPNGRRVIWRIDEVVGFDEENRFDYRCVFRTTLRSKANTPGDYDAGFIKNPSYRMGHDLRVLFDNTGLESTRWSPADEEEEEDQDFGPTASSTKNVSPAVLLDPQDGAQMPEEAARAAKSSHAAESTTSGAS